MHNQIACSVYICVTERLPLHNAIIAVLYSAGTDSSCPSDACLITGGFDIPQAILSGVYTQTLCLQVC